MYLTKDKQPVLLHDPTVNRTTNGKGRVSDLTLAEIKKLDAGSWKDKTFTGEPVPTLDEALAIMPRNIWLNIHLKEGRECGETAARAVVNAGRLHQAFLACGAEAAAGAKSVSPDILICNMERQGGAEAYVQDTIARKAQFIQLTGVSPGDLGQLITLLKKHGIRINYFGQEKPEELRALFACGVDFPLVNDVSIGLAVAAGAGIEDSSKEPKRGIQKTVCKYHFTRIPRE